MRSKEIRRCTRMYKACYTQTVKGGCIAWFFFEKLCGLFIPVTALSSICSGLYRLLSSDGVIVER